MVLGDLLNAISKRAGQWQDYEVYVIRLDTEIEHATDETGMEFFPVLEIDVEDNESEITFLTNQKILGASSENEEKPITVREMLPQLEDLVPRCSGYALFSGSSKIQLEDDYTCRIDIPLAGVGWSDEERQIILLQEYLGEE